MCATYENKNPVTKSSESKTDAAIPSQPSQYTHVFSVHFIVSQFLSFGTTHTHTQCWWTLTVFCIDRLPYYESSRICILIVCVIIKHLEKQLTRSILAHFMFDVLSSRFSTRAHADKMRDAFQFLTLISHNTHYLTATQHPFRFVSAISQKIRTSFFSLPFMNANARRKLLSFFFGFVSWLAPLTLYKFRSKFFGYEKKIDWP